GSRARGLRSHDAVSLIENPTGSTRRRLEPGGQSPSAKPDAAPNPNCAAALADYPCGLVDSAQRDLLGDDERLDPRRGAGDAPVRGRLFSLPVRAPLCAPVDRQGRGRSAASPPTALLPAARADRPAI